MRRLVLLGPVALAMACLGKGEGPATETTVTTTVPSYEVVGSVFDSLAGLRSFGGVPDALVSIGGRVTVTDSLGEFTVADVDSGTVMVRVQIPAYEPLDVQVLNDGNRRLTIGLRRYAPMVTGFVVAGDSAVTTVVDLQGRKTIDRWSQSNATLAGTGSPLTLYGSQMVWRPLDDFTWTVTFDATGVQQVDWDLHDVTGFWFAAACQAPAGCDHLFEREPSTGADN